MTEDIPCENVLAESGCTATTAAAVDQAQIQASGSHDAWCETSLSCYYLTEVYHINDTDTARYRRVQNQ